MTRLPRLLDRSLREKTRLYPTRLTLSLRMDPLSTAVMTLSDGEPEVVVNDWIELFTPWESAGIFRVTSVETDLPGGLRTVSLEHGFALLSDREIIGETELASEIGHSATVREAVTWLLTAADTGWVLDRCDVSGTIALCLNDANVLRALKEVQTLAGPCRWVFDQTSVPWRVSLLRCDADEAAACEMRMSRSIASMRMLVDRSDLCTRMYPVGRDGLTIAPDSGGLLYVEENTEVFGVVERIRLMPEIGDKAELRAAAEQLLHRQSVPQVSVELDGLDLAEATGEALDRLRPGLVCQVPLPAYGRTVTERITVMVWPDVLHAPSQVRVTLANRPDTASGWTSRAQASLQTMTSRLVRETAKLRALNN